MAGGGTGDKFSLMCVEFFSTIHYCTVEPIPNCTKLKNLRLLIYRKPDLLTLKHAKRPVADKDWKLFGIRFAILKARRRIRPGARLGSLVGSL